MRAGAVALLILFMAAGPAAILATHAGSATEIHVHMQHVEFVPGSVEIEIGTTILWHNHDAVKHDAAATDGSWASPLLAQGETWARAFDSAGTIAYHCNPHDATMKGTIVVVPGGGGGGGDPNQPPTVSITSPANDSEVSGEIDILGEASDADGAVARVEVAVGSGSWEVASGTTSWSFLLNTSELANGAYVVRARSFDGEAYSNETRITLRVANVRLPDLTLRDFTAQRSLMKQILDVEVANGGPGNAGAFRVTFYYRYQGAWHLIGDVPSAGLASAATQRATLVWEAPGFVGTFDVLARADEADEVEEESAANNDAFTRATFLVDAPPLVLTDPVALRYCPESIAGCKPHSGSST